MSPYGSNNQPIQSVTQGLCDQDRMRDVTAVTALQRTARSMWKKHQEASQRRALCPQAACVRQVPCTPAVVYPHQYPYKEGAAALAVLSLLIPTWPSQLALSCAWPSPRAPSLPSAQPLAQPPSTVPAWRFPAPELETRAPQPPESLPALQRVAICLICWGAAHL